MQTRFDPNAFPRYDPSHSQVLALGASTGGTQVLESMLKAFPVQIPGTIVTQHMPEYIVDSFCERLNSMSAVEIRKARNGEWLRRGKVLVAPGDKHLLLRRSGRSYFVELQPGPPVNHNCPSVDAMFRSVAEAAGSQAIGVILTGMGSDGASGLLEMKRAGARTLAQDEASCAIFGMPQVAIELGAVESVVSLTELPWQILRRVAIPLAV